MDHTDGGTLGTSSITLPRESRSMLSRGAEPYISKAVSQLRELYEFTPPQPGRRGEITIAVAVDGIEV